MREGGRGAVGGMSISTLPGWRLAACVRASRAAVRRRFVVVVVVVVSLSLCLPLSLAWISHTWRF